MKKRIRPTRLRTSGLLLCTVLSGCLVACSNPSEHLEGTNTEVLLAIDTPHVGMGGLKDELFNSGPAVPESGAIGFTGILKNEPLEISISREEVERNKSDLRFTDADAAVDPDAKVSMSFSNDPLQYVVRQLLGGMLSANYVVPDNLEGTVSFRTEQPVPRSVVPSIVRDILARNGYQMKVINGVYQIGTPQMIAQLEQISATGAAGDYQSRVIKLNGGNAEEIASVVTQILPPGATVSAVESNNSLVLHVDPVDERPVLDLIRTLTESSRGDDLVAVIPLRESPPEAIATSIEAYFAASGQAAQEKPFIVPLEQQQGLLVIARSERIMENVRTLIRGLDMDNRDIASLRVIQLKNLPAEEIASQLNNVYAESGPVTQSTNPAEGPQEGASSDGGAEGRSIATPATMREGNSLRSGGSPTAARFEAARQAIDAQNAKVVTSRQSDQEISIVPDTRNNALLVFATFRQFNRIREVVQSLDVPLSQVVIEATIVEVRLNDTLKYGVQAYLRSQGWALRTSRLPEASPSSEAGGVAQFDLGSINGTTATVVLEALQTVTDVEIISSPYLTVLDGRQARLAIGDQIPYLTQQTSASETGTTTTTNQVDIRDVGIILEVTPNIRADNSVLLNVSQEVSSTRSEGSGETLTPTISQRSINSDIVVHSGKTVLLGGLIEDRSEKVKSGVPVVSDVPLIGKLFQQTSNISSRTELLVMITPRVVRRSGQIDHITRLLKSRIRRAPR
ncbi:secretin N-terminal domain-containing protein [Labrenzia sp. OB1]|uniref:secretin N-terminal domain-containing protein n=1 Tax=Labrenzia sp. OB1 TaxID=1561204 RepID=UPI000AB60A95|nr:secretin N-terminal domain-containing protein [Labrenzia sp. OB1]